jgi:predicted RNA binding protein YcfA (HicA-like mRNA interferase family)
MSKPRRLSGDDVVRVLSNFGFSIHSQRGSHIKLRRVREGGVRETLTIPRHRELDAGTIRAIARQAAKYIPESELFIHFFVD